MWGPQDSVQLVQITPIPMVHGIYSELVTWGLSKPTNISWGPHIVGTLGNWPSVIGMIMTKITLRCHQTQTEPLEILYKNWRLYSSENHRDRMVIYPPNSGRPGRPGRPENSQFWVATHLPTPYLAGSMLIAVLGSKWIRGWFPHEWSAYCTITSIVDCL